MFNLINLEFIPYVYLLISLVSLIFLRVHYLLVILNLDFMYFSIIMLFIFEANITHQYLGLLYAFIILPIVVTETCLGLSLINSNRKKKKKSFYHGI